MTDIVIGVLAGMGPRTTSPFLEAVLDACVRLYGARLDADYPDIVIYSLPTPFRPDRRPDRVALEAALAKGASSLKRAGASFVVVPCNTAHLYFEAITTAAQVPVLHIVEQTLARLDYDEARPIAVLATRPTTQSGMYHQAISERGGKLIELPGLQSTVDRLIVAFKKAGPSPQALELWYDLRARLQALNTRQIVLGCTDLGFCAEHVGDMDVTILDSSDALAEAAVIEYCRLQGRALV